MQPSWPSTYGKFLKQDRIEINDPKQVHQMHPYAKLSRNIDRGIKRMAKTNHHPIQNMKFYSGITFVFVLIAT